MISKDIIKKIIIEHREFVQFLNTHPRNYSIEPNANYVIVGPRRAGKTFFLFHHIKNLLAMGKKDILYINFEDERLIELHYSDFDLLLQCYQELFINKPVVIFDEIQIIEGWEKFVRRLADNAYRVYVTGSNAKMLSKEIATTLGGRFLIKEIQPLSFTECLEFQNIIVDNTIEYSTKSSEIKNKFDRYLNFGGFPDTLNFENPKEYLSNLYQKVLYGDILTRNSIKNDYALRLLVKKIAECVTNETSFNRLKNSIISTGIQVGTATLIDYFNYMKDSYLINSISNFASKFTERESKKKFYFADTGILNLFLTDQPQQLLENLVFNYLHRQYKDQIYYLQKDFECDFYIPQNQLLIQVCLNLSDYETERREVESLKKGMAHLKLTKAIILTRDEKRTISANGLEIEVLPVWLWML